MRAISTDTRSPLGTETSTGAPRLHRSCALQRRGDRSASASSAATLQHEAEWQYATRELATAKARDEVGAAIVQRLSTLLGDEVARKAADSGLEDLQPIARALWFRKLEPPVGKQRYATTAWVHWEVPVARIVEAVPQGHRAEVARLLTAAK